MSRVNEQDAQPFSEHEIERYMTAFQAGLHVMDANPVEASRIGRLAGKTDAQILGGTPAASADNSQDLATLLAQPQSELAEVIQAPGISLEALPMPGRSDTLVGYPSLITAQAELDRERIRGEAELVFRKAELDAEIIRRRAELDAEQRLAQARLDIQEESLAARSVAEAENEGTRARYWQRTRAAARRGWLMSVPVLALAVLAAVPPGLWRGSLSPLVSIILASAAATFAVAYSAAILISVLRLVFGPHRGGPHQGAATALHLLVGADSTRRRRVPPE